ACRFLRPPRDPLRATRNRLCIRNQQRVRNFLVEGAAPQVSRGGNQLGSIVGSITQQPVLLASISRQ
ncbi:MAG: hypothetical protein ABIP92_11675, partial [Arthrobacter sp.]